MGAIYDDEKPLIICKNTVQIRFIWTEMCHTVDMIFYGYFYYLNFSVQLPNSFS